MIQHLGLYIRALRLPFATASLLPCLFGAMAASGQLNLAYLILAICAVVSCHLSANLINDYADHLSGADWIDRQYYGQFGGSKLIQQRRLSPRFYLWGAILGGLISMASVIISAISGRVLAPVIFLPVFFLSWSYSSPPLQLSYNRLGEAAIAALFGPAIVLGSAYLQTGTTPEVSLIVLSIPFGLITAAMLVTNEVPDAETDLAAEKHTLVTWIGPQRGYLLFGSLIALSKGFVLFGVLAGWLSPLALLSLIIIWPAWIVAQTLKNDYRDKNKLKRVSQLMGGLHMIFCVSTILGCF